VNGRLWAPWRIRFIRGGLRRPGCVFCRKVKPGNDARELVVVRYPRVMVVLNRYPYTNGHLLVIPYRHVGDITDLTAEESAELLSAAKDMMAALRRTHRPDGFNVGINVGRAAGAGIADHVHLHIVPRWSGDVNCMSAIGDVRVISESLTETYQLLCREVTRMTHRSKSKRTRRSMVIRQRRKRQAKRRKAAAQAA